MKRPLLRRYPLHWVFLGLFVLLASVSGRYLTEGHQRSWSVTFPGIGTGSSPRMADLNGDGVLDLVMGAGGKENQASDTAVLALNGRNGEVLWHLPGCNQII